MAKKKKMTGWYDPVQLTQTGIRVAISTIFGQFADKREALAAANAIEPQPFDASFDYSAEAATEPFWLDFIADSGDGWNSTYAMARLLARDALTVGTPATKLDRGRVLVMGGDQVYPTASREEYDDRLIQPFEQAYHPEGGSARWSEADRPDLYAIPGNHDWYDGLNAFFGLFCRRLIKPKGGIGAARNGRVIGGRQTRQTRSYFAINLPGGWWLWGTDSQLEGYIDQPQIEFFRHVAESWMDPGSKLILCVGAPSWEYVEADDPTKAFANFSYLERLAGATRMPEKRPDWKEGWPAPGEPMGHRLRLSLTGDSHHYARYVEGDRHYVTCGGGGAFLHPTHHLTDKSFDYEYPGPGVAFDREESPYPRSFRKEAIYPGWGTSWLLTLWNFLFAVKNWKFPLYVLLPAYFLFTWLLHFNADFSGRGTIADALAAGTFTDSLGMYWKLVVVSPWPVILAAIALGGYRYFSDVQNSFGRLLAGGGHAAMHAAAVTATTCLVIRCMAAQADGDPNIFLTLLAASAASAVASATVFGGYLWFCLAVCRRHWNEAFSSFGHRGYKCFLRLRFSKDGALSIFPIGLTKVPFDRWKKPKNPELRPHLIEGPITID